MDRREFLKGAAGVAAAATLPVAAVAEAASPAAVDLAATEEVQLWHINYWVAPSSGTGGWRYVDKSGTEHVFSFSDPEEAAMAT